MKKYMHYRVGLLIGLLGFHTLSSCVHTRQALAIDGHKGDELDAESNIVEIELSSDDDLEEDDHAKKPTCRIWPFASAYLLTNSIVVGLWGLVYVSANCVNRIINRNDPTTFHPNMQGDSEVSTGTSLRPINPYISLMADRRNGPFSFIINATKKDPAALVPNGKPYMHHGSGVSTGTLVEPTKQYPMPIPNLPTIDAPFIINATKKDPAALVPNGKPFDWPTHVEDPDVLDDQIIQDLKNHNFQKKVVKYWLRKGLNINAKDSKTNLTLLFYAIDYERAPLVKFLIDNGANVNVKDRHGITPLAFLTGKKNQDEHQCIDNPIHERIIGLLMQHEAKPCYNEITNSEFMLLIDNLRKENVDCKKVVYKKRHKS